MKKTHLITGIPRSGTSLLISLISTQKAGVCLSEPTWLKQVRDKSPTCTAFAENLHKKIITIRSDLKNHNPIPTELSQTGQSLPTNYFSRNPDNPKNKVTKLVSFPKDLATKTIYIKSNTQITACLAPLAREGFKTITALVRDPIAILHSWRSLDIPVSRGKLAIGIKYADETKAIESISNLLEKQIFILDWFFKQFHKNKTILTIIRYEDLVSNPEGILATLGVSTNPCLSNLPIKNQNLSKHYNLTDTPMLHNALRKKGRYWQHFYPEYA